MNVSEHLRHIVPNACEELLASIGFRAKAQPGAGCSKILARSDAYVGGITSFSGTRMRGQVVVVGTFDFFAESRPGAGRGTPLSMGSARDWIRVRDWTMELTNQALGRIKNRLWPCGVQFETLTPRAVSGHALVVTVRERRGKQLVYAANGQEVSIWFEAVCDDEVAPGDKCEPLAEGELLLF